MKIYNLIKEELKNIECGKYFDVDSIYKQYVEFDMPLYSIINKRKTASLIEISPNQYINNIASGFGLSYDDALKPVKNEIVDKYVQNMLDGNKFPVPYFVKNKSDQEGRHRVMAAKKLGCKYIPVIKFINLSGSEIYGMLMQFEGESFEDVNEYFIDQGFKNGITEKCYDDLQRYLEINS